MRDFLNAAKIVLSDLASSIVFLALFFLTHSTMLSVGFAVAFGLAQIGTQFARGKPIGALGWLSLILVIAGGAATLVTDNPRFVLFKPSVIYTLVGVVMLKPGWMIRYLPAIARAVAPDVAFVLGLVWAGLMFVSALVNTLVAVRCGLATWALVMPTFGLVSKVATFLLTFGVMRIVVRRRVRAMPQPERDALLISTGRS